MSSATTAKTTNKESIALQEAAEQRLRVETEMDDPTFGVKDDPLDPLLLLRRYRILIEDGQSSSEEARTLRQKLEEHFGSTHPNLLECDRLIRFQALKSRQHPQH